MPANRSLRGPHGGPGAGGGGSTIRSPFEAASPSKQTARAAQVPLAPRPANAQPTLAPMAAAPAAVLAARAIGAGGTAPARRAAPAAPSQTRLLSMEDATLLLNTQLDGQEGRLRALEGLVAGGHQHIAAAARAAVPTVEQIVAAVAEQLQASLDGRVDAARLEAAGRIGGAIRSMRAELGIEEGGVAPNAAAISQLSARVLALEGQLQAERARADASTAASRESLSMLDSLGERVAQRELSWARAEKTLLSDLNVLTREYSECVGRLSTIEGHYSTFLKKMERHEEDTESQRDAFVDFVLSKEDFSLTMEQFKVDLREFSSHRSQIHASHAELKGGQAELHDAHRALQTESQHGLQQVDQKHLALKDGAQMHYAQAAVRELFTQIDADHSGFLSQGEMAECFEGVGVRLTSLQLADMMRSADPRGSGQVDFGSFSAWIESGGEVAAMLREGLGTATSALVLRCDRLQRALDDKLALESERRAAEATRLQELVDGNRKSQQAATAKLGAQLASDVQRCDDRLKSESSELASSLAREIRQVNTAAAEELTAAQSRDAALVDALDASRAALAGSIEATELKLRSEASDAERKLMAGTAAVSDQLAAEVLSAEAARAELRAHAHAAVGSQGAAQSKALGELQKASTSAMVALDSRLAAEVFAEQMHFAHAALVEYFKMLDVDASSGHIQREQIREAFSAWSVVLTDAEFGDVLQESQAGSNEQLTLERFEAWLRTGSALATTARASAGKATSVLHHRAGRLQSHVDMLHSAEKFQRNSAVSKLRREANASYIEHQESIETLRTDTETFQETEVATRTAQRQQDQTELEQHVLRLTEQTDAEARTARAAEDQLTAQLNAEQARASASESVLTADLAAEQQARAQKELTVDTTLEHLKDNLDQSVKSLRSEAQQQAEQGRAELAAEIGGVNSALEAHAASFASKIAFEREFASRELSLVKETLTAAVDAEVETARAAERAAVSAIETESALARAEAGQLGMQLQGATDELRELLQEKVSALGREMDQTTAITNTRIEGLTAEAARVSEMSLEQGTTINSRIDSEVLLIDESSSARFQSLETSTAAQLDVAITRTDFELRGVIDTEKTNSTVQFGQLTTSVGELREHLHDHVDTALASLRSFTQAEFDSVSGELVRLAEEAKEMVEGKLVPCVARIEEVNTNLSAAVAAADLAASESSAALAAEINDNGHSLHELETRNQAVEQQGEWLRAHLVDEGHSREALEDELSVMQLRVTSGAHELESVRSETEEKAVALQAQLSELSEEIQSQTKADLAVLQEKVARVQDEVGESLQETLSAQDGKLLEASQQIESVMSGHEQMMDDHVEAHDRNEWMLQVLQQEVDIGSVLEGTVGALQRRMDTIESDVLGREVSEIVYRSARSVAVAAGETVVGRVEIKKVEASQRSKMATRQKAESAERAVNTKQEFKVVVKCEYGKAPENTKRAGRLAVGDVLYVTETKIITAKGKLRGVTRVKHQHGWSSITKPGDPPTVLIERVHHKAANVPGGGAKKKASGWGTLKAAVDIDPTAVRGGSAMAIAVLAAARAAKAEEAREEAAGGTGTPAAKGARLPPRTPNTPGPERDAHME